MGISKKTCFLNPYDIISFSFLTHIIDIWLCNIKKSKNLFLSNYKTSAHNV